MNTAKKRYDELIEHLDDLFSDLRYDLAETRKALFRMQKERDRLQVQLQALVKEQSNG